MTANMGCSVSSPTNVCSDTINSGRCLGRARGPDSFATYVLGKPDAGNPRVRFDEGRELADAPRSDPAYSTPFGYCSEALGTDVAAGGEDVAVRGDFGGGGGFAEAGDVGVSGYHVRGDRCS